MRRVCYDLPMSAPHRTQRYWDLTGATPPADTMVTLAEEAVAHQIDQLG